jgi:hypothetical protein
VRFESARTRSGQGSAPEDLGFHTEKKKKRGPGRTAPFKQGSYLPATNNTPSFCE